MKLHTTDFPRKSQFPLMLALGMLPVCAAIILHNAPEALPALAYLIPAYLLSAWLCLLLPGKLRIPAALLFCAGILLLGLYTLPITNAISPVDRTTVHVSQSALCLLVPLMLCALLMYSLQFAAWPRDREIAFNWYAAGVIAHLLVQLIAYAARLQGSTHWARASLYLTAAFIPFVLLVLLSMNRSTMQSASLGRQRVPPSMRRRNVAITLSLLLGALVIAGIPAIVQTTKRIITLFFTIIGRVLAFIASLLESENPPGMGGSGGGMDMMPPVEYQEPSLLAVILEKIAMAAALVIAVLLVLFALKKLFCVLRALLRRIAAHLSRYAAAVSQDYVDEITDTREEGGEAASLLSRLRSRMSRVSERNMTPTERIRYRYRLLLRRHPDWHVSQTARENLPPEPAALYEAARYSGKEISQEEADQFTDAIKRS